MHVGVCSLFASFGMLYEKMESEFAEIVTMKFEIFPFNSFHRYFSADVMALYKGKWLFCMHKERTTWEHPSGWIEEDETPLEAAKRELQEETGAVAFDMEPLCDYFIDGELGGYHYKGNGQVYFAVVHTLGEIPPDSEMGKIGLFESLPDALTYPILRDYFEIAVQKKQFLHDSPGNIAKEAVDMKLVQATKQDFQRITRFYRDVIARTEHMDTYARWIYGQHPTDEMIRRYIQANAMYYCEKDGSILSAVAVTQQGEEYHGAEWSASLEDDEVSVVHLLCVAPEWQGKGIARDTMGRIIELSREMGKRAVRLDALACNTPTHRLYAFLGFQKRAQRRWYADNVGWTDFFLYEFIL